MNNTIIIVLMRGFGVLLIALAVFRGIKGQFKSEDNTGMTETTDRSRNPARFWGQLALQAVIGLALLLAPVKL